MRNKDLVFTSRYTIINTVTGPEDYISFLQPSEEATPLQDTNTYYSRISLTDSIQDVLETKSTKILTDDSILTQVVITESMPARGSLKLQLHSNPDLDRDVHIYATKTILTTVSYVVTPALFNKESLSTKLHTRVIESVITDFVPNSVLGSDLVSIFRHKLMQKNVKNNRKVLTTLATLLNGQTLKITAASISKGSIASITSFSKLNENKTDAHLKDVNPVGHSVSMIHSPPPSVVIRPSPLQNNMSNIETEIETDTETETETETETDTESDDELSVAESEIKDVYLRPLKNIPSQSPSQSPIASPLASSNVEQLIGSFNFQRFRPVFNVMADLLQKNLVSRQSQKETSIIATEGKNPMASNPGQSLETLEGPNYIPLQIVDPHISSSNILLPSRYSSPVSKSIESNETAVDKDTERERERETETDVNLSRLSAHSLHINPPEFDISDLDVIDDNWQLQQQNKDYNYNNSNNNNNYNDIYRNYIQSLRPPTPVYQHSLLNNGIPIRPGEIINANADVIIGKPNGIGARFSLAQMQLGYRNQSAQNHVHLQPSPSKKKSWIPSMIPLSLIPPHIDQDRLEHHINRASPDTTITILRPPSKDSKPYFKYISTPVASEYQLESVPGVAASLTVYDQIRSPTKMSYNKLNYNSNSHSHIYGSEQQIANLNSELNNNEILEIRQIPQIFSTKLTAVTQYPIFESSQYVAMPLKQSTLQLLQPAISGHHHQHHHHHHQVNLKLDVLSHNVNMNAPPLTFKRGHENYPVASAIQGHIAVPPMPLVKIPLNKAHVEVRLTPQSTQLAVEPPPSVEYDQEPEYYSATTTSTFKQRNQNLSKTLDTLGTPIVHGITSASSNEKNYIKMKKPNRNLLHLNTLSISISPQKKNIACY